MKHSKHGSHPHDKHAAMPQFHEGHWEKGLDELPVADQKYSSEFNQAQEYRKDVEGLVGYVKKHKMHN